MIEGRNRAVGAAQGDVIAEIHGGIPDAPGWLDYNFTDLDIQASPSMDLLPIRGMLKGPLTLCEIAHDKVATT